MSWLKARADETPVLSAELYRVLSPQKGCSIRENKKRIVSSLREPGGTAEVETKVRDRNLWNAQIRRNSICDVVVHGIQLRIWGERNGDAIHTETRFIHKIRSEYMRFVQRKDLPVRRSMIPEARDRVELQIGLSTAVGLECIKPMQLICIRDLLHDVQRILVKSAPAPE